MGQSSISYLWREPEAAKGFATGVSLHSHTNQSKETLDFISELSKDWNVLQPVMRWAERRCKRLTGINPDYAKSYWTPPLTPSLAFDLERRQIEEKLQITGLVSLTDHDDIQAPMLLRTVAASRHIPVSVEWTVPFGATAFAVSGWSATLPSRKIPQRPPTAMGEWRVVRTEHRRAAPTSRLWAVMRNGWSSTPRSGD